MSSTTATTLQATVSQNDASTRHYDPVACKIGMWLFLFTEVFLFGALFIAYAVYLNTYRWDFQVASGQLDKLFGATNTMILLTSSLTMALSIAALSRGNKRGSLAMASLTLVFALAFLIIKAFEWEHKFAHDIYPASATMLAKPPGEQVFYGLYFTMTGLHALHVIIGGVVILVAMYLVWTERIHRERVHILENVGLYWHLVDLVWIFLFPLYYLLG